MPTLPIYQVDAFTDHVFGGNPAAVVPLETWLADTILQHIATENNLSETAFYVPEGDGYRLRWFTPAAEVRLCGHATLATAHVLYTHLGVASPVLQFDTLSGRLTVQKVAAGYRMDFPADASRPTPLASAVRAVIGQPRAIVYCGRDDLLAIVEDEAAVADVVVDLVALRRLTARGLIVSALGEEVDFVSRCFFPRYGIDEDPVTGSAHCLLTPYWAERLEKHQFSARQISARVGRLACELRGDRVWLTGQAVTYLEGTIRF